MYHKFYALAIASVVALTAACNDPDYADSADSAGPYVVPAHPAGIEMAVTHDTYSSALESPPVQDGKPPVLE